MADTEKELLDKATQTIDRYATRDTELDRMDDYYFLEGTKEAKASPPEEGIEVVRQPHATNVMDLVQDILAGADITITRPARTEGPKEKKYADICESFLHSVQQQSERMQRQDLVGRAAWLVGMRGALAGRAMPVRQWAQQGKDESGAMKWGPSDRIPIMLQLRDPRNVYPEFGADGLAYVVERWDRTVQDIRNTYGEDVLEGKDLDEEIEWTEFWDDKQFCYWADGKVIGVNKASGPQVHGYGGHIYAYEFARQTGKLEPDKRARPLLAGLLEVIDRLDILDSQEMTFVSQYIGTSWVIRTALGKKIAVDLTPGGQNYLGLEEDIEPLQGGRTPLELQSIRERFSQMFERGTFPSTMFGEDPGRVVAGYAINLLNQSGQLRLSPLIACVERFLESMYANVLMVAEHHVSDLVGGAIPFYVTSEQESAEGDSYQGVEQRKFDPKQLDGYYEVQVRVGDVLPGDEQANLQMAQQAQTPGADGRPLLSWETTITKFKLVTNAAEERARIDREIAWNHPQVIAMREALYVAKIKEELAEELAKLDVDPDKVLGLKPQEDVAGVIPPAMGGGAPPMEQAPGPAEGPMMEPAPGIPPAGMGPPGPPGGEMMGAEGMPPGGVGPVPPEILAQLPPDIRAAVESGEITPEQLFMMLQEAEQGGQGGPGGMPPAGVTPPGMGGGPPGPPPGGMM